VVSGPDGTSLNEPRSVLIWSGEDDPADTLIPRLAAMDADLKRIHFVSAVATGKGSRPFDPAQDMARLIKAVSNNIDIGLLIVDPVVTAISGDSHKNAEVRRGLAPLVAFGQELRAAVLGIIHFTKGSAGKDPIDRLTGSLAFGAAPRLVFDASKKKSEDGQETDERVFVRVKSNIGPDGGGFEYTLGTMVLPDGIEASRVEWASKIEGPANEILAEAEQTGRDDRNERDEAEDFLTTLLADRGHTAIYVKQQAKLAGISDRTLRRAQRHLGIKPMKEKRQSGHWIWKLPRR
jgi:putative DNA primase/helicase